MKKIFKQNSIKNKMLTIRSSFKSGKFSKDVSPASFIVKRFKDVYFSKRSFCASVILSVFNKSSRISSSIYYDYNYYKIVLLLLLADFLRAH